MAHLSIPPDILNTQPHTYIYDIHTYMYLYIFIYVCLKTQICLHGQKLKAHENIQNETKSLLLPCP